MRETKLGAKLLPLVQLLPAIAVSAAVLFTLPRTVPVLAEVPERLTAPEPASEAVSESAEPEEEALPRLPYADGVYVGSSRGYGGKVKVQVTMADGVLTDVQILDASHETASFLRRAKRLTRMVVEAQSWEVDAISEATYTSRGILGAVRNALTGEVVNNPLPPQPKPAEPLVVEEFTAPSAYRDGIYTASAEGFGGPITVQVTISGDAITDITVLDHAGETSSYYYKARGVIASILESGSPEVDAVSGATYSSTGILNAVKLALNKAANTDNAEETALSAESEAASEVPETPAEEVPAEQPAASAAPEEPSSEASAESSQSILEWAQDLWDAIFPEEETASSAAPVVVFTAGEPAASEAGSETEGAGE